MLPANKPELLDSWKEIAVFLNRGVRTVQRWEHDEGLPVHRHNHRKRDTVFAFSSEIRVWLTSRDQSKVSPSRVMPAEPLRISALAYLSMADDLARRCLSARIHGQRVRGTFQPPRIDLLLHS
jgi:hypothetical protein